MISELLQVHTYSLQNTRRSRNASKIHYKYICKSIIKSKAALPLHCTCTLHYTRPLRCNAASTGRCSSRIGTLLSWDNYSYLTKNGYFVQSLKLNPCSFLRPEIVAFEDYKYARRSCNCLTSKFLTLLQYL